jgi:hypothetical protein
MKSFNQYITEMPYFLGNLSSLTADNEIEQQFLNQEARRLGRKVGTVNGADFYLAKVGNEMKFIAVRGEREVVFQVYYSITTKPNRWEPFKGLRILTQSYIELIDKSWNREILLTIPTKYLTKNRCAILTDRDQSSGGRNLWIRMMRKFSAEGHQIGWCYHGGESYQIKPDDVDFDAWIKDNYFWGQETRYEYYQYFILPK